MKTAVLVKTNLIGRDSRVLKERGALKEAGYNIRRLCWDREGGNAPGTEPDGTDEEKRLNLKAPWGIKVILFLPVWWAFVLIQLMKSKWDIAHAVNLDSAVPAVLAGILKGKPVVYEVEDAYEDEVRFPSAVRRLFVWFDRLFMRMAAGVILVDETQVKEFGKIPNKNVAVIYDSPPDVYGKIKPLPPDGVFTMLYDGTLAWERDTRLENIWEAIKNLESVRLTVTGFGNMEAEVRRWCEEQPEKVKFLGWVTTDEVMLRSLSADLLLALRSSRILTDKYNCGSKVLKAMMCGKPSLVVKDTSSAEKVAAAGCGLAVDIENIRDIRDNIVKLKDAPELRRSMGGCGRKAYEERYRWEIMKQRLLELYASLLEGQKGKRSG